MRTIRITLTGHCEVFRVAEPITEITSEEVANYDYMDDLVEDGKVGEDIIELSFIKEIGRLTWREFNGEDDEEDREFGEPLENEEPIVKKGKYVLEKEYFEQYVKTPFVVQRCDSTYAEYDYDIELCTGEVFDPMKLQLIKSDYEVEFLPYGIVTGCLWYNNKPIVTCSEPCFDPYAESGCFLYKGFGEGNYLSY